MKNTTETQEIIQRLRAEGWSVAGIGRELGVTPMAVWRWLSGKRHPENAVPVVAALRRLQRKPVPRRPYQRKNKAA